jgi:hypothetical protein
MNVTSSDNSTVSGQFRASEVESGNSVNSVTNRLAMGLDTADVYLRLELNGKQLPCLIDSGCEITLVPLPIHESVQGVQLRPTTQRIFAANGSEVELG